MASGRRSRDGLHAISCSRHSSKAVAGRRVCSAGRPRQSARSAPILHVGLRAIPDAGGEACTTGCGACWSCSASKDGWRERRRGRLASRHGSDKEYEYEAAFRRFDVQRATCSVQADTARLLACIETGFGDYKTFNQVVRRIMSERTRTFSVQVDGEQRGGRSSFMMHVELLGAEHKSAKTVRSVRA